MDGQVPDWPDALDEAAEERGLGSMTVWNCADIRSANRTAAVSMLFVAVVILVIGTVLARDDQREYGEWWRSAGLLGVGLIALVLGLVFVVKRGRGAWVCLYDHGLAWQAAGKEPVAMRWTEVEEVARADTAVYVNGIHQVTHHDTFVRGRGAVIPITRIFPAVEDLTERIITATAPILLATMSDQLDRGESVAFGSVSINSRGISYQQQQVPWVDVAKIRVHKSELQILTVGQRKPWVSISAVGFPNLPILVALSKGLIRAHRAPADQHAVGDRPDGTDNATSEV